MDQRQRGMSLLEVLVVTAIVGLLGAMVVASAESLWCRFSLGSATTEMRTAILETRWLAMSTDRAAALKFHLEEGEWTYAVYLDGDGDGIRNDDIRRGVDTLARAPRPVRHGRAYIGLPGGPLTDPVNGGQLNGRDAVRFGSSTLCSFSRDGDVANGSIVLTDGKRVVLLVVNGAIRRISTFRFDGTQWHSREL